MSISMLGSTLMAGALISSTIATSKYYTAPDQTYRINQYDSGQAVKSGPVALLEAYRKFSIDVPDHVVSVVKAIQNGSVVANPNPGAYDREYLCQVTVGADQLVLDFDTGSSDLWVFSTNLPKSEQEGHEVYKLGGSLQKNYSWNITYGDGSSAGGTVYVDTVNVGGVIAQSQAVEAATEISRAFVSDKNSDGLLGLAFSSINTVKPVQQLTFFDNVKSSLYKPLFAVLLKKGAPGNYDFGFIDTTQMSGDLAYTTINPANGFWQFVVDQYAIGPGATKITKLDVIADTGTSLILLPDQIVHRYYKAVKGAYYSSKFAGYIFPCSATLPAFSIFVAGERRTTPGVNINYGPVGQGKCYGGIQSNADIGISILGDCFLKGQYVVFDSEGPRIGFAQQAGYV